MSRPLVSLLLFMLVAVFCCVMAAPGSPRLCHDGYFQCGEGLCIPDALVCDGELNCIAGNDEENCAQGKARNCFPGYFQCAIGNCIPDSLVCNGELNCVTGNDEAFC
ncbi:low-density lipoprotein receptor-like isoform X2 [Portunus trituberculatus]|uniref:low-density lipoprotein receptor-like isoform X2 n=1 Tax=Portunus trituberculatus TaxID=210409 RepID=UPI001E1D1579|nr:low-density lipoprotein receptor-like isoform X2 [Portunus trituberculatus]